MNRVLIIILLVFMIPLFSLRGYAEEPPAPPQLLDKEIDYIVKNGDTLWDISKRFYGDPFLWPRLWQQNQYITNPHTISPGHRIRLYPYKVLIELEEQKPLKAEEPKPLLPPQLEEVPAPLPPLPEIIRLVTYPEVASAGFITDKMVGVGKIVASKIYKFHFVSDDEIYIKFQSGISVKKGDLLTIFRLEDAIQHPITGKIIGRKVLILGTAMITKAHEGEVQTALITSSYDDILIGDELTAYFTPRKELAVEAMNKHMLGYVVAFKVPKLESNEGDVVYIDRGEDDGIRPGHIFHIVRRGGMAVDPYSKKGKLTIQLPRETIARVIVILTQQKTSSAVIVQSRLPVLVGDEITTISE